MSHIEPQMSVDQIRALIFQLPPKELLKVAEEIKDRAETIVMMQLAETAFQEWNEPGEDIYDAEA